MNDSRGVPTVSRATELLSKKFHGHSKGLHLESMDILDLDSFDLMKNKEKFHLGFNEYMDLISNRSLDYDHDEWSDHELENLLPLAYERFRQKATEINFKSETKVVIKTDKISFQFSTGSEIERIVGESVVVDPFVEITLDHNLLHRLLRGPRFAHWNNAEIGSHLRYVRKPNRFERGLYHCLCFFHS